MLILYGSTPIKNSLELMKSSIKHGHQVVAGEISEMSSKISPDESRFWLRDKDVSDTDLCFLRSFGRGSTEQFTGRISMVEHLEVKGIKVINSTYPFRRSQDKYATQYTLQAAGLPIAETYTTENMTEAYHWSQEHGDIIYKSILNNRGKKSMRFKDPDLAYNAYKMLNRSHMPYLLQKDISNPVKDLHILVVGDEIIGAVSRHLYDGKERLTTEKISEELVKICVKASNVMELDYSMVNIIDSDDGPIIIGVNGSPDWQKIGKVINVDVGEKIVSYAESLIVG